MRAVLTIAGSDSSCGAGVQADLKTFQRFGVYGVCAVTAVTAQTGARVTRVMPLPPAMVSSQIDAALGAVRVHAVKTGMLWSASIVIAVRRSIMRHRLRRLVIDPVLSAHSGRRLMSPEGMRAMVRYLFPLADLVTPNIPEAEELAGIRIRGEGDILEAARRMRGQGAQAVLIKGGHAQGEAVDWFCNGTRLVPLGGRRVGGVKLHGSGCILSAAIAAGLAKGMAMEQAVHDGRSYVRQQLLAARKGSRGTARATQ